MLSVETEKHLGFVARIREKATEFLFPLTAFREFFPPNRGDFQLLIYKFLEEKEHRVVIKVDAKSGTREVLGDGETLQLKKEIFSSPEVAALLTAIHHGCPKRVESYLRQATSLSPEVREKIWRLAQEGGVKTQKREVHEVLDEIRERFLEKEFGEQMTPSIEASREKMERILEEQKNVLIKNVLISVYERLVGRE